MSTHVTTRMDDATHSAGERSNPLGLYAVIGGGLVVVVLGLLSLVLHGVGHDEHHEPPAMWWLGSLPFVGMLGCIAVLPLVRATHHWWENNLNRLGVAMFFAALTMVYYLSVRGLGSIATVLNHAILAEYIPFIVLLFCLYVISGGISLTGDLAARPATNTAFLAMGALIASFVGTTGASMLLIRPLLQTNSERRHVVHTVVFFIFLVSNVGGCLLPIGDPPLFLGYLLGVNFLWTLNLWMPWAVTCALLLVIYYFWDLRAYRRELPRDIRRDETQVTKLSCTGKLNLVWLAGVVLCVALVKPGEEFLGLGFEAFPFMRELLMLGFVALSLRCTAKSIRTANRFTYHAILEVAALFIGIFICMQPALQILGVMGGSLGIDTPMKFFWVTGGLSAVLDNAPTYVVFFETAKEVDLPGAEMMPLPNQKPIPIPFLTAISLGAVFLGAMTYIGNGPNFMVRAIAEKSGVKMPSFFGYMVYSVLVLGPVFALVSWLFF